MTSETTSDTSTEIRMEVDVAVGADRAFAVFTEQFDKIKPREHNLLGVDIEETVFEPRVGGDVYDRGTDGSTCRFARVLAFEPPHRFMISWDISPQWQIETDLDHTSEVEVTFTETGPGSTHVVLVHRHLDRHGEGWQSLGSALEHGDGWRVYLERYAALAA